MTGGRKPLEADIVIGANIRRLRNEQSLTLQELALRLGMSHQQLQKYEKRTNRVSAGVLYHVAGAFCIPVDALFEGSDDGSHPDGPAKALHLARSKCHTIVDRAASAPVLDSIAKVIRALRDTP